MTRLTFIVIATATLFALTPVAGAHMAFKKEISKKYPNMKITCNACHVNKKPKTQRNEFGKLFAKQLKDKQLTANFKSREGDERREYLKEVMVPEFAKVLKKIQKMKKKDQDKTYDELIKAGLIPAIIKKPEDKDQESDTDQKTDQKTDNTTDDDKLKSWLCRTRIGAANRISL